MNPERITTIPGLRKWAKEQGWAIKNHPREGGLTFNRGSYGRPPYGIVWGNTKQQHIDMAVAAIKAAEGK